MLACVLGSTELADAVKLRGELLGKIDGVSVALGVDEIEGICVALDGVAL